MQILANALPGFRDLRAPVIAGYLWIVFAWLLVDPNLDHRPSSQPGAALYDLGNHIGHIGVAVAVSILAYFAGSVSQAGSDAVHGIYVRILNSSSGVVRVPLTRVAFRGQELVADRGHATTLLVRPLACTCASTRIGSSSPLDLQEE